ncbi:MULTISPECIES: tRNA (guanosine(46)-N7)-methyltransferase TrmB [Cupriavidus]|uniref:tRNA (guanosine(46)-N7)-methyltransferase TrmB n=1 Tax=Cupriavidus TaxID=106589 RepID=UPI00046B6A6E|nr:MULTISPECIES: tRNA (guanosine(46)-N7)-methyltransferase TrmB [Cupriavidus]KWR84855.1 tRNA (guanine-N7)-methyltransferase [Cupriavidus sp. SHE]QWC87873.1 tRNA (guanosine(46)-N7)-methyltransferase TrmB [Cupriavidus metallidurans]
MLPQDTNTDPLPGDDAESASGKSADASQGTSNPGDEVAHPRRIRSFVRRAGRTSTGQQRAMDELGPTYIVPYQPEPLDWAATFGREAPSILEIGFGMGETTAHIAGLRSQDNFLGCEVHEPGVGALLKLIGERGLQNVRIMQHDAVEVAAHMLTENSLDGVHIYFPDPWHKKRHNKRRLVQPPLVKLLASRLKPGGYIHCATDWEEYAHQMVEVLSGEPALENTSKADGGFAERPDYRPVTKFEKRGLRLGHGVWDVVFRKK